MIESRRIEQRRAALGWVSALAFAGALSACGSGTEPRDELGGPHVLTSSDAGVAGGGSAGAGAGAGGASGASGLGGAASCTPRTCEQAGAECGAVSDGCGGVLACGTCAGGEVCSSDTRRCEATSAVCERGGLSCGLVLDACGVGVGCGSCGSGEVCSGRTGACGACEPLACAADSCGSVPDGCGGSLECGACPDGQVCDALTHV